MRRGVSLFIFCQSLGWDMMQRLAFVDGLAENRSSMRPILGGSSAALPTVLSGALPDKHGHFAWFFYSPGTSPFRGCKALSYLPRLVRASRRFRNAIVRSVMASNGITGRLSIFNMPLRRLPLFDFVERRNLFEPGALNGVKTLIDFLGANEIKHFCSDHSLTDPENADALAEALHSGEIAAAFLHLAGIAHLIRTEGLESSALRGRVAWADHRIRRLYETATAKYDRVDLIVFSDCGALPVTDAFDLQHEMQQMPYAEGQDYVAVYEPTMARFWFLSDRCRAAAAELLDTLPHGRILSGQELSREGCRFPDDRFGEVIFLSHPGTVLFPNYINAGLQVTASGYLPDGGKMAAGFASNLADTRPPASLTGIYDLLLQSAARSGGIEVAVDRQRRPAEAMESTARPG